MVILTPSVKVVSVTPDAEKTMAYVARVSNPNNQDNPNFSGLLRYCIQHEHWSVFEQAYMTLEIETSLAIATQILRHRSFTFQQFSQRYADASLLSMEIPIPDLRRQDTKNRQNSTDDLDQEAKIRLQTQISAHFHHAKVLYDTLLQNGVAKECARAVLPQNTMTRIYMTGSVRSWIHYISLRGSNGTQKEHMDVANLCKCVFICQFPTVSEALGWVRTEECPTCQDAKSIIIE
jgi:thymidylate synthase (FAD)